MKQYLGDGVYVEIVYGGLKLTTSDGLADTNTIFFEPEVLDAFLAYCNRRPVSDPHDIPVDEREGDDPPSPMERTMPRTSSIAMSKLKPTELLAHEQDVTMPVTEPNQETRDAATPKTRVHPCPHG